MAEEMRLVSHGWKKRCALCERRTHAKWHEIAREDINPVALIQFVERQTGSAPAVIDAVVAYVQAVVGMEPADMRAMLELERQQGLR